MEQRRRWIDDPNEPDCPINRAELTYSDLLDNYSVDDSTGYILRILDGIEGCATTVPNGLRDAIENISSSTVPRGHRLIVGPYSRHGFVWLGTIEPGVIFIDLFQRQRDSNVPQVSEVTQALYQQYYEMEDLGWVLYYERDKYPDTDLYSRRSIWWRLGVGAG